MSDRLNRAFRALRESEEGATPDAEQTLARIVRDARKAPHPKANRLRTWVLLAAALAFSTAAAARGGGVVRRVRTFLFEEMSSSSPSHSGAAGHAATLPAAGETEAIGAMPSGQLPSEATGGPGAARSAELPSMATTTDSTAGATTAFAVEPMRPSAAAALSPMGNRDKRTLQKGTGSSRAGASAHTQTNASSPPLASAPTGSIEAQTVASAATPLPHASKEVSADSEMYAAAHRLHFQGNSPATALTAWEQYLQSFPTGRFAPDARYNRAIDLLKLKRYRQAREALEPFASGAYGSYHRDDAKAILRSIPKSSEP